MVCRSLLFAATCCAVFIRPSATSLVLENEVSDDECTRQINRINDVNMNTKFEFPPPLTGKWVSERCETRPGPVYLLRSYTFYPNNSFQLVQFFYNDESCSSIKYTIAALGSYRIKSRPSSPSPTKLTYDLTRVTIVVHDTDLLGNLLTTIKSECPGMTDTYWRPLTEYVIYASQPRKNQISRNVVPYSNFESHKYVKTTRAQDKSYSMQSNVDSKCLLSMLKVTFDELLAVRVRTRSLANGFRHELLLAKAHPYQEGRKPLQSTFQLPLVLVNETYNCHICNTVSRSTNMFVNPLTAKPRLRPFLNGEWISDTCEEKSWPTLQTSSGFGTIDERPTQIFAMRSFRVNEYSQQWELETKYYSNYLCKSPIMVHQAQGQYYYQGTFSNRVGGAVDIDFRIDKSYLLILKESGREWVQPMCYPDYWQIGVKMEIPPRYACTNIGITSLPVKYNIARLDTDDEGSYILYLGDQDTDFDRPTSYEYPLVQCSSTPYDFLSSSEVDSASLDRSSILVTSLTAIFWLMNYWS